VEHSVWKGHGIVLAEVPEKRRLSPMVEVVSDDRSRPDTLIAAVYRIDAIGFTHGSAQHQRRS